MHCIRDFSWPVKEQMIETMVIMECCRWFSLVVIPLAVHSVVVIENYTMNPQAMGFTIVRNDYAYSKLNDELCNRPASTIEADVHKPHRAWCRRAHRAPSPRVLVSDIRSAALLSTASHLAPHLSYASVSAVPYTTSVPLLSSTHDIELEILAPTHLRQYPPGIVVIRHVDKERVETLEKWTVAEEKAQHSNNLHWDRLDGTGRDLGPLKRLLDKAVQVLARRKQI